ncbi:methyl-accepting chemotaxis protein [Rhizobium sp. RU35A]|uniref:methyl-accepting chemotaxis protein n=1 Tax=Rhizobium sp. RU35A TaxID=1907414 RepID=UPI00122CBA58|nr:methyl-accepting chemotaxis protein [Rhizobium sp. RU35A]
MVGNSTYQAYRQFQSSDRVEMLARYDKALFLALLSFRSERGDSATALTLAPDKAAASIASFKGMRTKVQAAMADAAIIAADFEDADLKRAIADLNTVYASFDTLRKKVDANIELPLDKREAGLDKAVLSQGNDLIASLEKTSTTVEGAIRSLDETKLALIQTRSYAWAARSLGGSATVILNGVIVQNRKPDATEIGNLTSFDAGAAFAWRAVDTLISHPSTPVPLKERYLKANEGYFKGDFATWRSGIVAKLVAGEGSPVGIDEWRPKVTAALGLIADVASLAMDSLNESAANSRSSAQVKLIGFSALFVIVMAIGIGGMATVVLRVVRPIGRLTRCMNSLAEGNRNVIVPGAARHDEIGEMARSVEVFRQAAIRNAQLEAEAEENRRRAEAEREELQRRAEEDANDRLNRATGALAAGLKRLAAGDLLCEIQQQFAPQFEPLRHDFNTSVSQLRDMLLSVGQSATVVNGGSAEISGASDNLAKRTEQQAASLEETAAALEEITTNVKMTSQRAVEARDLVRGARGKADQSGVVVDNAVRAMQRIEHASGQISQIISVIDEIAFQTNLLALNAGVEAARAGEAGKGFAVVAQEVRELAQRSANAAKEIKVLIGNSETAVNEGVKLVNETGSGLAAIAEVVQAISGHMDAIASAAQEQSSGLGELNTAVNQMDQSTQQNAAMVEEMNAAGVSLAQESYKLSELLSHFQLGSARQPAGVSTQQLRATGTQMRAAVAPPAPRPSSAGRMSAPAPRIQGNAALAQSKDWEEF